MEIGKRLRELRETKQYSQGDMERRTGLLRCYVSRVENGHTIPSLDTLVKWARALEMPLYRLFTDEEEVKVPSIAVRKTALSKDEFGNHGQEATYLNTLKKSLAKISQRDREILLKVTANMVRR